MTEQQAMRMALEAFEEIIHWYALRDRNDVLLNFVDQNPEIKKAMQSITALRQALEQQPADEPVAWMWYVNNGAGYVSRGIGFHQTDIPFAKHTPLYTRPPQRKPLTLEQLSEHWKVAKVFDMTYAEIDIADYVLIVRDVETLHGIKENT